MLENLTRKVSGAFEKLRSFRKVGEKQINDAIRDLRVALIEADVEYGVVKDLLKRLRERALKEQGLNSDALMMLLYEELLNTLGSESKELKKGILMMVGLQGTGKTTTAAKLALHLKEKGYKLLVCSTDTRRPAAILQLERLCEKIGVEFLKAKEEDSISIAKRALSESKNYDFTLLDTAGRLHIDQELMQELESIKNIVKPSEVIYVADAMQGQTGLESAKAFHEKLGLTGLIVTKMDGDARGGIVLSVRASLGVGIKFIGVGEKLEELEPFYPDRIAQRIIGLGDIQSLAERARKAMPEDEAQSLAMKVLKGELDLEDMLKQIRFIKNMGPIEKLVGMLPGVGAQLKDIKVDEKLIKKTEAIILSMTKQERKNPHIINMSRKIRIAKGSGTSVSDVNRVLKDYEKMKKMIRKLKSTPGIGPFPKFPM
ncbi:MAG: signal recognition particle protein [Aquificaceae bacterium]